MFSPILTEFDICSLFYSDFSSVIGTYCQFYICDKTRFCICNKTISIQLTEFVNETSTKCNFIYIDGATNIVRTKNLFENLWDRPCSFKNVTKKKIYIYIYMYNMSIYYVSYKIGKAWSKYLHNGRVNNRVLEMGIRYFLKIFKHFNYIMIQIASNIQYSNCIKSSKSSLRIYIRNWKFLKVLYFQKIN